ncbi:putative VPS9 domain protein [Talaromyces proteolyticus]|uniref:VPS9 domain protein n=1 Tax=Talaromyces proteolyticus TaxID=1131652 RepID=A0AAD4KKB7_9EURO|nr:putative VPS9 domain protein [Talaromyces proteolyticus]KAH8691246.1 putative VPS9 domain protein [Talaromyces proteolyticus]
MASTTPSGNAARTPRALHPTRSFTRMESPSANPTLRSRAKTMQALGTSGADPHDDASTLEQVNDEPEQGLDVFEKRDSVDSELESAAQDQSLGEPLGQEGMHELPIELASLTDRFVQSLSARVHSTPPSIERICTLFQEFYVRADSHIATHISTLASRINRDGSLSNASQKDMGKGTTTHQMLTASEVTERRKARKQLPFKRLALEETVERRACERVYDKIWRHKSTLDEVRDEKLRSKTAAMSLLGIGLKDLGIEVPGASEEKENDASSRLSPARESLSKMNECKYPLGKLQCLIAAHKAIVDTLTALLGSSSSADEILPTLIYTLITSPPEGINVISNLLFIQRFRSANKIDGESAYCLTNLEAAITFLEAVDLSSLSADLPTDGQPRLLNAATTGVSESVGSARHSRTSSDAAVTDLPATGEFSKSGRDTASATLSKSQLTAPTPQQRRLSNLFQPPAKVLGAANDVVRNTADQGLKNISNALDNSFNFVIGRMKEMQSSRGNEQPLVPKTLDEARRLVTSPSILNDDELASESPSIDPASRPIASLKPEDRRTSGNDAQRAPRDRSADSARSGESRTPGIVPRLNSRENITPSPSGGSSIFNSSPATTPLESMKNFGNTFNPLNHIPGMIRGLGRNTPEAAASSGPSPVPDRAKRVQTADVQSSGLESTASSRLDPPIRKFLEVQDVRDLRIGEVAELLQDYKRLATALYSQSND